MTKSRPQLLKVLRERRLIRFSRRFEESEIRGYVLAVGVKFFLLALVSDRLWFDGFECFRIKDVYNVRPDTYAAFAEAALKKRGERVPRKPRISMGSIEEIILTAGRAFPLITIHREQIDPKACWIGRVLEIERGRLSMLEISPCALWKSKRSLYRLGEITHVNFGGDYENALYLVGGEPSSLILSRVKSVYPHMAVAVKPAVKKRGGKSRPGVIS